MTANYERSRCIKSRQDASFLTQKIDIWNSPFYRSRRIFVYFFEVREWGVKEKLISSLDINSAVKSLWNWENQWRNQSTASSDTDYCAMLILLWYWRRRCFSIASSVATTALLTTEDPWSSMANTNFSSLVLFTIRGALPM